VRALVRDAARAGLLSRADVTLATGDVLEATGFERAARGCDVVFHAAAVITPRGGWEAYRRPNVEGTRNAIADDTSASRLGRRSIPDSPAWNRENARENLPATESSSARTPTTRTMSCSIEAQPAPRRIPGESVTSLCSMPAAQTKSKP